MLKRIYLYTRLVNPSEADMKHLYSICNDHKISLQSITVPKEIVQNSSDSLIICDAPSEISLLKQYHIPLIYLNRGTNIFGADLETDTLQALDYDTLQKVYHRFFHLPLVIGKRKLGKAATANTNQQLILRELTEEDYENVCAVLNTTTERFVRFDQKDDYLSYINQTYAFYDYGLFGVFLSDTDKTECFIGLCGFSATTHPELDGDLCFSAAINALLENSYLELSYLIAPDKQRNGYGKKAISIALRYAAKTLHVPGVFTIIKDSNPASLKLAEAFAMKASRKTSLNYSLYTYDFLKENERIANAVSNVIAHNNEHPDTSVYFKVYDKK
ncbi:MAG: GNAT family N-acetyltransferase [Lachnospiraceae bacterium]|nr:GNAT family N-acetyltransferase [Lachnospiraceae bacterium]